MDATAADVSPVAVRRAAMDLLSRREHSYNELIEKLFRRFPDREILIEQITLLKNENLQSDERFVESFINSRKSRGKGPAMIRQQLKQRGVDADLVASYLNDGSDQWLDIAIEAYLKKFGDKPVADQKDKARRLRFMQYRGFSGDVIRKIVQ